MRKGLVAFVLAVLVPCFGLPVASAARAADTGRRIVVTRSGDAGHGTLRATVLAYAHSRPRASSATHS